ncbi:MAG: hypothetical protein MRJ65_00685 [Candidatus Brocadiaceae bacterium]|nr:hypothetical protein [Candidatus Brocadiaceae bacterium]
MTLCIAWIREFEDNEELIFATGSTLTGGEKWNHGIKLFELPRKDCLLCFAGETYHAYPLILNLISTIKHNNDLQNPVLDIQEVLLMIVDTFSELVKLIFEKPFGNISHIGSEAKFLFGGWSWKENRFRIWNIYFSKDIDAFLYNEETEKEVKSRVCVFLGDPEDECKNISKIAKQKYKDLLIKKDKFDSRLDMEPLEVLVEMSRSKDVYEVDGAIQIGKIFKSGTNEFFGIYWPSINGKPSFLGKIYEKHSMPKARYFDPDTCLILEEYIPKCLANIEVFKNSEDYEFLKSCYCDEDNYLKLDITEKEREKLLSIFQAYSYKSFMDKAEVNLNLKPIHGINNE